MERIRSYDRAMLAKASHLLPNIEAARKERKIYKSTAEPTGEFNEYDVYSYVPLVERMYMEHKTWTDKKFQPLLPYLQKKNQKLEDTKQSLKKHYQEGLRFALAHIATATWEHFDRQDAIVTYTKNFITMLRACERLEIRPDPALELAKQSHRFDARKLIQLFKENTHLPHIVLERAATNNNPDEFIKKYKDVKETFTLFTNIDKYQSLSEGEIFRKVHLRFNPYQTQEMLDEAVREDYSIRFEPRAKDEKQIQPNVSIDVSLLRQKHQNWCGYASLSMVLQYYGYRDVTPEKLFTHINGEYDKVLEYLQPGRGPDIDSLALAVQELTPLQARIVTKKDYDAIQKKNPNVKHPKDVLHSYIKGKIPCIIRIPRHFMVVTGINTEHGNYFINNPLNDKERGRMSEGTFDFLWGKEEPEYPRDSRYLMLAIYPPRKKA